jgi:hypothetical protein
MAIDNGECQQRLNKQHNNQIKQWKNANGGRRDKEDSKGKGKE